VSDTAAVAAPDAGGAGAALALQQFEVAVPKSEASHVAVAQSLVPASLMAGLVQSSVVKVEQAAGAAWQQFVVAAPKSVLATHGSAAHLAVLAAATAVPVQVLPTVTVEQRGIPVLQQALVAAPKSAAPQVSVAQVPASSLMTSVPVQVKVLSELQTLATAAHVLSFTAALAAAVVVPLSGQLVVMQAPVQADASLAVHVVSRSKEDAALPAAVGQVKATASSATADVQEYVTDAGQSLSPGWQA